MFPGLIFKHGHPGKLFLGCYNSPGGEEHLRRYYEDNETAYTRLIAQHVDKIQKISPKLRLKMKNQCKIPRGSVDILQI